MAPPKVSVTSRTRYDDTESLRGHLSRAGFEASAYLENPINLSPEIVRQITVHLSAIVDNAVGALVAAIVTWALVRKRTYIAKGAQHKVQVNVR